ncbi:siroheme synthase CysG [Acuticoccus sp. MNP-M23]|uniref:siroheme synthase CysG n=1 Tax=Acuticoccus sp. MNP-M23 TaxID=3072793 RepID=UPI002815AA3C|nr:siroheme synthase CysG [Acuticoccus sp. MNP-M23]WMS43495.1 siroheme synthase CysG [Acuticoccus sp. MNP-M23]
MTLTPVRSPAEAKLRRLDALTTLPIFVDLRGKGAVVAGGTEAAAWKAELLAAAGADVMVYAENASPEMHALVERGAAAGSLVLIPRNWDAAALEGAALAIADADTEAEAARFAAAARAAGVPANVIDKPAYCAFQFGSIVNRSPVVVGISTTGAAPILGQAIRRRIETLLPPVLSDWAALAERMRSVVISRLEPGLPRRTFWERFVDRAFSGAAPAAADAETIIAETAPNAAGKVVLVGAGPGDASLLTLAAVRALQASDVILFDDLVSDDVLELARREARRIAVGKRGARESCRQEDITELMIKLAKAGRSVVRLKAGDPSVFGRSGEEIASLNAEGIPVEVVPGITSASAMAARLGMSLTHRDHAQSLTFFTGHSKKGVLPDNLDLAALLGPGRTAIVYMGARTAHAWVARALAAGVAPSLPAVAAASVSRADETVWSGSLAALPNAVAQLGDKPVLIGVGPVFAEVRSSAPATAPLSTSSAASTPAQRRPHGATRRSPTTRQPANLRTAGH